ncbi:hydrogen-transporting ATP synthase, rotational mechanism [Cinnamomum micranthum f. kanehirae]|uniref:Hydrogen-transporting ATP synthase, rotational mechanism n=1 Tax=Cinnamomum micranthum f. kanehirae TaxID=337451 RepID=A0A443Q4A2_9MAGN|nr:hydrogen-transporting ATP synthase, rotational mechanism [Cinnamomum micranthum f. kanehirae]
MASKLHQLQFKAVQASQFVKKHGSAYYKQLLEQNKQHIQDPPTAEKCNLLAKQLFYTRLARWATGRSIRSVDTKEDPPETHYAVDPCELGLVWPTI